MTHYKKRVDNNQKTLIHTFICMGASVLNLSTVGRGCPDLLIGYKGKSVLVEIKSSDKIDVIVNLAGAPISKRWSNKYKQELIDSRVNTTKTIISLIEKLLRQDRF
jgi:NAD dependent epimerase/dehydratase family enzyme